MIKVPSSSFISHYDDFSKRCRDNGEILCLTNSDEQELIIMSLKEFKRRESIIALKEKLLDIEASQQNGEKYYNLDELNAELEKIINTD